MHFFDAPFRGYMSLRRFVAAGAESSPLAVLSGPGHDVALVAALALDPRGELEVVLKGGDTRPPRVLRGEPYVKIGVVGGRLDHPGMDAQAIAALEVEEEVGARVLEGGVFGLGAPVPTQPDVSTEADRPVLCLLAPDFAERPQGDGGGMELPGLLRPLRMPLPAALLAFDDGRVGEAARARVTHARALERIGYLAELGVWLHDLPAEVRGAWRPLGLEAPIDPRDRLRPREASVSAPEEQGVAAEVDDVQLDVEREVRLDGGAVFLAARATHRIRRAEGSQAVGRPFPIQFLHLPDDRLKLTVFAEHPARGPLVLLEPRLRAALRVRARALADEVAGAPPIPEEALEVLDLSIPALDAPGPAVIAARCQAAAAAALTARGLEAHVLPLGASSDASPGQSSQRHHFLAARVSPGALDSRFVPLAEALLAARTQGADAAAEAALLRLAALLGWIPSLERSAQAVLR
jgi:hypothetical protein